MKKYFLESRRKGISYVKQKEGRLTGLVISGRNCILKHFIEENIQGKTKDDEEDLNSHRMTLRKGETALEIERGNTTSHIFMLSIPLCYKIL
jgi:hypothetical protein